MSNYQHFSDTERAVLQARAERAARTLGTNQTDDRLNTLLVTVGGETYALPIEAVIAVYEAMAVVPVPCTPPFLAGITNIRGHIIPVLDLGQLLNAHVDPVGDVAALVVTAIEDLTVALRVDEIGTVQGLPTTGMVPDNLDVTHRMYLKGILPNGTILLDVQGLLSSPAIIVNEALG
jgi:purine-binding chemotaxis protein CheW